MSAPPNTCAASGVNGGSAGPASSRGVWASTCSATTASVRPDSASRIGARSPRAGRARAAGARCPRKRGRGHARASTLTRAPALARSRPPLEVAGDRRVALVGRLARDPERPADLGPRVAGGAGTRRRSGRPARRRCRRARRRWRTRSPAGQGVVAGVAVTVAIRSVRSGRAICQLVVDKALSTMIDRRGRTVAHAVQQTVTDLVTAMNVIHNASRRSAVAVGRRVRDEGRAAAHHRKQSGQRRTVWLTSPVHDDERIVLIASKGGDDRHPDWYHNVVATPTSRSPTATSPAVRRARPPEEKASSGRR